MKTMFEMPTTCMNWQAEGGLSDAKESYLILVTNPKIENRYRTGRNRTTRSRATGEERKL